MSNRINFYRTPLDKDLLKSLTERSDLAGFLQSLGIIMVYAFTTLLSLYFFKMKMWLPMVAACYLHSIFSTFIGMESCVHELSHKTPFKTKWLNEFFYGLFSFFSWNNPIHFRESHRRHHQFTVFQGLDKEVVLEPGPIGLSDFIAWFFFDWKRFSMVMGGNYAFVLGRDVPDVFFWDPLFEKNDHRRKKMFLWSRLQLIGHLILITLFIYFKLYVLIYTVSMSYFFATFLARSFEIVQHSGMKPNVPDWRMTCHTMIFGPITAFFYWRMNYHVEHHMYGAVPFYKLNKLHKAMAFDTPEPVRGHLKAVRKILNMNKQQKLDPEWFYEPKFPQTAGVTRLS
jgi:fatty acid desaturase